MQNANLRVSYTRFRSLPSDVSLQSSHLYACQHAFSELESANFVGYFRELRPVIPSEMLCEYHMLRNEFIGNLNFSNVFRQRLECFALKVCERWQ